MLSCFHASLISCFQRWDGQKTVVLMLKIEPCANCGVGSLLSRHFREKGTMLRSLNLSALIPLVRESYSCDLLYIRTRYYITILQ